MIRKLIQCAICVTLCPLLAAQQDAHPVSSSDGPKPSQPEPERRYVTLSGDTNIELLPPGSTKFAHDKAGDAVQFVVDKDVIFGGMTLVHAGVPVAGVVDFAKGRSHFKHRAAEMEIRVTEMVSGRPIELHLRCFDPGDPAAMSYSQPEPRPELGPVFWGAMIAVVLGLLALWGGDR